MPSESYAEKVMYCTATVFHLISVVLFHAFVSLHTMPLLYSFNTNVLLWEILFLASQEASKFIIVSAWGLP